MPPTTSAPPAAPKAKKRKSTTTTGEASAGKKGEEKQAAKESTSDGYKKITDKKRAPSTKLTITKVSLELEKSRPDSITSNNNKGATEEDIPFFNQSLLSHKKYNLAGGSRSSAGKKSPAAAVPQTVAYAAAVAASNRQDQLVSPAPRMQRNGEDQRIMMANMNITPSQVSDVTFHNATQQWNQTQNTLENDKYAVEWEIDQFVKKFLFKGFKFITNPLVMHYSVDPKSICQYSCKHLSIQPESRFRFWSDWSRRIEQSLSRRRSDVNTAMKKAFIGNFVLCCGLYNE